MCFQSTLNAYTVVHCSFCVRRSMSNLDEILHNLNNDTENTIPTKNKIYGQREK